jgi:hypothetical protein
VRTPKGGSRYATLELLVGAVIVFAGACSGDSEATSTAASGTASAATAAPASAAPTVTASKVSANSATIAELQAAFEAASIANAARWAREVDEYRPYATSDTNFAKLRGELAKYNPAAGVVDAIIGTLTLP